MKTCKNCVMKKKCLDIWTIQSKVAEISNNPKDPGEVEIVNQFTATICKDYLEVDNG